VNMRALIGERYPEFHRPSEHDAAEDWSRRGANSVCSLSEDGDANRTHTSGSRIQWRNNIRSSDPVRRIIR
jgi:hypothetical protein